MWVCLIINFHTIHTFVESLCRSTYKIKGGGQMFPKAEMMIFIQVVSILDPFIEKVRIGLRISWM